MSSPGGVGGSRLPPTNMPPIDPSQIDEQAPIDGGGEIVEARQTRSGQGAPSTPGDNYDTSPDPNIGGSGNQYNLDDVEVEIVDQVFSGQNPANAESTPRTERDMRNNHGDAYNSAVDSGRNYLNDPSPANEKQFIDHLDELLSGTGNVNIMEVLFLVFRESVREVMEDQKYWLTRMQEANLLSESISDYMKYLTDKSMEMGDKAQKNSKKADKVTVWVDRQQFDTTSGAVHLDEDGNPAPPPPLSSEREKVKPSELDSIIKEAERQAQQAKNMSDRYETNFQGTDQRKNQIFQLLSSVQRTMNEMRGIGASSRSGL